MLDSLPTSPGTVLYRTHQSLKAGHSISSLAGPGEAMLGRGGTDYPNSLQGLSGTVKTSHRKAWHILPGLTYQGLCGLAEVSCGRRTTGCPTWLSRNSLALCWTAMDEGHAASPLPLPVSSEPVWPWKRGTQPPRNDSLGLV